MAKMNEAEMFKTIQRLMQIYLESYPNESEQVKRFVRWAHNQYGYVHGNS